jgi:hypothetical protein
MMARSGWVSELANINDVLDGHVVLDLECLDRVYLNGYVPKLQVAGQVVTFLTEHLGNPIPSPALFKHTGERFRAAVYSFAETNGIPMFHLNTPDRSRWDDPRSIMCATTSSKPARTSLRSRHSAASVSVALLATCEPNCRGRTLLCLGAATHFVSRGLRSRGEQHRSMCRRGRFPLVPRGDQRSALLNAEPQRPVSPAGPVAGAEPLA